MAFPCNLLWVYCVLCSVAAVLSVESITEVPGLTNGRTIISITVSGKYLWAVYDASTTGQRGNNVYCPRPCTAWENTGGQLDQIDANDKELWGVNDRNQVYKRRIDADDGPGSWSRITPSCGDRCCDPVCLSDIAVSDDGYVWGIATNDTVYRCPNLECDDTTDWVSVDPEILLVQIEAGDEEVWGVNGSDHIFKRPVNGSGEWSIVPGRMRYISVSRGDYIWGIAPNDSLYVCEKPCTGDWQYIGGSYLEIDGGSNDEAVGLTSSSNTILSLSARAIIGEIIHCIYVMFIMVVTTS